MDPERWQQIKSILEAAQEQPADDRQRWLVEACGGDEELLREAASFLEYEAQLVGFIEEPVLSFLSHAAKELDGSECGRRVGPYRLVRLLGQGGMGAVYLAEREEEFEQRVALKLVRRTLESPEMIRRFHAERQILARLEHPNIARLLDGGTTEDGVPYFAMELVEGVPIDVYCDEHRLTTRQRLELFLTVCSALEMAHQNLVIHRDLKPGNILVDGSSTPKLLDFGIATLLRSEMETGTSTAPVRQGALTPRYASPEQLAGGPVGTASDVYSLGVVLYLVLTGRLPCGLEGLQGIALYRKVCEQDPEPASEIVLRDEELLGRHGDTLRLRPEEVSSVRDGSPRALHRNLVGDIDCILAKALRKDVPQRYASVEQMAADLRRHLDGLPVLAHPATSFYRMGKFVRRHRLALTAVAAMLLLALAFTVALTRQLYETERERDRNQELSAFLVDLFYAADPDRPAGSELTVRDLLERGRNKLDVGLEEDPAARARLLRSIGEVYFRLGDYPEARDLFTTAIELRRELGQDHPDLAAALNNLAVVHQAMGELELAESFYRECIAMRRRLGLDDDLIKPRNGLASILQVQGKLQEAEEIYRENLARRRGTLGGRHPNVAKSQRSLATVLYAAGDLDAAEELLLQALDIYQEVYGRESTKVAMVLVSLGRVEHVRGNLEEAEAFFTESLEIRRHKLGDDHLHTALAKKDLAALLLDRGKTTLARELLAQSLVTFHLVYPDGDPKIAEAEALLRTAGPPPPEAL